MFNQILLNLFLAFVWTLLQNSFTAANFLGGYFVGAIIIWIFHRLFPGGRSYLSQLWACLDLVAVFFWELLKANIAVAKIVLSPKINITPGIVAVPTVLKDDLSLVLLANLVTLTPGTLTMDISPDKKTLYVHVLNMSSEEEVKRDIKDSFERRILAVTGGGHDVD